MEDNEGTSNQLSFDDGEERASTERWTCEACGCNTNASSDQSCTICGTASGTKRGTEETSQEERTLLCFRCCLHPVIF